MTSDRDECLDPRMRGVVEPLTSEISKALSSVRSGFSRSRSSGRGARTRLDRS